MYDIILRKGETMDSIFMRKSIRRYLDTKVEPEKVEKLMRAAMMSPTACNQREFEFVVVDDRETLEKLSKVTPYTTPAGRAPLAIVPVADKKLMKAAEFWEQDLGACVQTILLEAVELELGGVWMGIAPHEDRMKEVADILAIPDDVLVFAIIAIGYPTHEYQERDNYEESRVHYNRY